MGGAVNIIAGPLVGNGSVNLPVSVYDTSSIKSYKATCLALYNRHEFFVSGTPTACGTGSYFDPVTMPEAVKFVTSLNDGSDYIIYLKDSITLGSDYTGWPVKSDSNPEKSYAIINPASNLKLKICSYGNPATPYTLNANCSSTKNGRVMFIGSKADVTLENIIIKGGFSEFDSTAGVVDKGNGAGIYIQEGNLTLEDKAVIRENYLSNDGGYAAGIYNDLGRLVMKSGSEVTYNGDSTHTANGGGVWASILDGKKLEIKDTTFARNTSKAGPKGSGGALYVQTGKVLLNGSTTFDSNEAIQGHAVSALRTGNSYIHIADSVKFVHDSIKQTVSYDYDSARQMPYITLGNLTGTPADQIIYLTLNSIAAGDRVIEAADASVDLSQYVGNFVVLDSSLNETDYYIDSDGKLAGGPAGPAGAGVNFTPKTAEEIAAGGYISTYSASNSFRPGDKITCSSVEQLAIISDIIHAGNNLDGVEILLTQSFDVGTEVITLPMSTLTNKFNGTFDGNGNSITGFGITGNGFFDGTLNATIKNLKLEGSVSADSTNAVGGLIGTAYGDTTIENCELTVNVTTTKDNVGGIVGNAIKFTSTDNFIVRNCINNSEVSGGINVGGIAGAVGDYASVVIENCLNNGNITSTNLGSGIVSSIGSSDPTIKNCVNTGRITGTGSVGISASLAGSTAASVQNCFNLTTASSNLFLGATIYDTDSCVAVDYYNSTLAIKSSVSNAQGTYPVNTDVAQILNDWCRANPSSSCYTWKYKGGGGTELTFE